MTEEMIGTNVYKSDFINVHNLYSLDMVTYIKLSRIIELNHYEYHNTANDKQELVTQIKLDDNMVYPVSLEDYMKISYRLLETADFVSLKVWMINKGYLKDITGEYTNDL